MKKWMFFLLTAVIIGVAGMGVLHSSASDQPGVPDIDNECVAACQQAYEQCVQGCGNDSNCVQSECQFNLNECTAECKRD